MKLGSICNRAVVFIEKDASLVEVARLMRERHVGSLVVVDEITHGVTKPIGMITDRDLVVEVLAEEVPADAIGLKDVMSTGLIMAREDDDLRETLQQMRNSGVRRVPVVDAEGSLVGVVSVDDILSVLAEELTDLPRLIDWGWVKEKKTRTVA